LAWKKKRDRRTVAKPVLFFWGGRNLDGFAGVVFSILFFGHIPFASKVRCMGKIFFWTG
jgi:hypothetical protein